MRGQNIRKYGLGEERIENWIGWEERKGEMIKGRGEHKHRGEEIGKEDRT